MGADPLSPEQRELVEGYRYSWGTTSPASPAIAIIDDLAEQNERLRAENVALRQIIEGELRGARKAWEAPGNKVDPVACVAHVATTITALPDALAALASTASPTPDQEADDG